MRSSTGPPQRSKLIRCVTFHSYILNSYILISRVSADLESSQLSFMQKVQSPRKNYNKHHLWYDVESANRHYNTIKDRSRDRFWILDGPFRPQNEIISAEVKCVCIIALEPSEVNGFQWEWWVKRPRWSISNSERFLQKGAQFLSSMSATKVSKVTEVERNTR